MYKNKSIYSSFLFILYTAFEKILGMYPMPGIYFAMLFVTIFVYMILITVVKRLYVRKYGELL